jgi:glutamyl-tRNA reductase
MKLLLIGTSHRLAPVEVRERVAVDPDGAAALATRLAGDGEAVCLSTCNRTEIYLAVSDQLEADRRATAALAELAEIDPADLEPFLYRLEREAAAVHLFRVAAGLDSLVPGEGEILGQVRTAYERGKVGPLLDRLFSHALHTGKKVRTDTAIAESPGTTSSAAAALAAQVFGDLKGARIAIVGAGKIGRRAARRLTKRGASLSFVANRTETRGRELADELGGETIPLEQLVEATERADILVSSTSSADVVLTKDELAGALPARKGRPLLLIDLAVPRDLDPAINELADCYLYDIDDLEAVVH